MGDKVFPVDVSTLQERVYRELRDALHQGRFVPGEVITIRALARDVGTSPMPVREAIQRLVAEKALVQLPNRNIRVLPFNAQNFAELTRIRMVIEGSAACRAAMLSPLGLADRLRAANLAMRAAIAAGRADDVLDANKTFHFELYKGADSPQLLEIITTLWLRSGPFIALTLRKVSGSHVIFEAGTRTHERIIDAVARRDPKQARFTLALDIRATAKWFQSHYGVDDAADRAAAAP